MIRNSMKISIAPRCVSVLILGILLEGAPAVWAQADKFQAGQKIEYRVSKFQDIWEEGVYVGATPEGRQPIIRKKPTEFFPEGAQTAFDWEGIRPLGARPAAVKPAGAPVLTSATVPAPSTPSTPAPADAGFLPAGNGLLTQADVLQFLRSRLGEEPFAHPRRAEIKEELAVLIKRRGVNFRYENLSDFSNQLGKFGASSEIIFPLQANFGPPTRQEWLMGRWNLSKIGATVDYKGRDGYRYRQTEIGVGNVGALTLHGDGSYAWKVEGAQGMVRGEWRKAAADELPYQGGDAVVLLKAKGGVDWIVHQDRVTPLKGDWITVTQLGARQIREGGFRESSAE